MVTVRTHRPAETAHSARRIAERLLAWALPSVADLLFALCLLGIVFVLQGRTLGQDGDIGWHIRLGLRTLAGDFPRTDTFSSTKYGQPLVGMEWLAEVWYAAVWRLGGLNGVVALAGLLVAATAAGLLLALRARGTPFLLALPLTLLALALTSIHWVARPHLFSLPLTLWWSEWLWRYWRDGQRRRLWYFPPVMLLWVNLHGGFVAGLLLLGTAVVVAWLFPHQRGRAEPRALTVALAGSLLATTLTPWGAAWIGYFAGYFADPLVPAYTQELQSPDFHTLAGRLFLALLFVLAAAWIFGGRRDPGEERPASIAAADPPASLFPSNREAAPQRRDRRTSFDPLRRVRVVRGAVLGAPLTPTAPVVSLPPAAGGAPEPLAWATAGLWTLLAFSAIRAVPLWALIVTPLLAEALTRWLRALAASQARGGPRWAGRAAEAVLARSMRVEGTERQIGRGLWAALAVAVVVVAVARGGYLPGASRPALDVRFSPHDFPVAAVARLQRDGLPPGRGFNTVEWGGYLIYSLPRYHVFIDSRSDFYGSAVLRDYLTIIDVAPGWQRTLDRYQIRWALLPSATALTQVLAATPGWSCAPEGGDGVAALCVRAAMGSS